MNIGALAKLVIEKFKEADGYSELNDKELFKSIYGYLDSIYRKHFEIARKKIKDDESKGIFPDQKEYKERYEGVEDIVMMYANKLAATDKSEI